ncbi:MAG TPA: ribonuclease III [Geminicoccaceae bacterium]
MRRAPRRGRPPAGEGTRLARLEERLGHAFTRPALLEQALTHASVQGRGRSRRRPLSNERLEFLGDRVLGLAVAESLMRRFPDDPEGALSARHSVLVSEVTLARVARGIDLGPALEVAPGQTNLDRDAPALLANALEAVIAAVYLDAGWPAAAAVVGRLLEGQIAAVTLPPKDPKSMLQERLQGEGLPLPRYEVVKVEGPDHAPSFEVRASLQGTEVSASAAAPSKRAAEQAAAARLIERLDGLNGP